MKLVISLGGSVIVPDKIDVNFLERFKKVIDKIKRGNKIVIVTGGGSTARKYIEALRKENVDNRVLSYIGFNTTKLNALLLGGIFGVRIAETMNDVKNNLKKTNVVVCGSLNFNANGTSDWSASEVARDIRADLFVNITNVKGLYDKNPKEYKNAKFIPEISFNNFLKIMNKIKFEAGQHFVLDQSAARIISKHKIKTIITKDINNLIKIVKNQKFIGTAING